MRKPGWKYWETCLPDDSVAWTTLEALAKELGMSTNEANRVILVAYSKMTRNEGASLLAALFGMPSGLLEGKGTNDGSPLAEEEPQGPGRNRSDAARPSQKERRSQDQQNLAPSVRTLQERRSRGASAAAAFEQED